MGKNCALGLEYGPPRYNEYFVLSLAARKNGMAIQMVDRPNTTPVGQDREILVYFNVSL